MTQIAIRHYYKKLTPLIQYSGNTREPNNRVRNCAMTEQLLSPFLPPTAAHPQTPEAPLVAGNLEVLLQVRRAHSLLPFLPPELQIPHPALPRPRPPEHRTCSTVKTCKYLHAKITYVRDMASCISFPISMRSAISSCSRSTSSRLVHLP